MKNNLLYELGKMLGFKKDFLDRLNEEYQKADQLRRYQIMAIFWNNFSLLLERITRIKHKQFLAEVALGKRKLENNLYQQAREAAKEYLLKTLTGEIDDNQKIEEIRQRIISFTKLKDNHACQV